MKRARQLVLTIHGVTPDRGWQSRTARVLEPHFQCISVNYWQYGSLLGALAVVFNISVFIVLFFAVTLGRRWHAHLYIALVSLGVLLIFAIASSIAIARYRRRRVVDRVKAQISAKNTHPSAHVIAHSFGTYIVGWALEKFQDLRFGRIILVGCVLPRGFDWLSIRRGPAYAFEDIRNDVGLSDPVVRLLRWVGRLVPDLGTAGLFGFTGDPVRIHTVSDPWGPCAICLQASSGPLIHNIFLEKYRHSDWALGPGHVRELWLPHLWGLSPREFNEFLQCCRDAAYAREHGFWQDLDVAERRLAQRTWSWTRNFSLKEFIAAELDERIRRETAEIRQRLGSGRARIIEEAFTFTYLAVAEAYEESADTEAELTAARTNIIVALYPKRAIARAIEESNATRAHS